MQKIETSKILVNSARIKNLDTLIYEMEENDKNYKYSVGWIDTLSTGKNFGRSILIFGNHATSEDLVNLKKQNILSYKPKKSITLPARVPFNLINRFTVKIFNEIWYLKHFPKNKKNLKDISNFFFPLDSLKNWNKLYGPKGFIQYQIVLPNNHKHLIYEIIEIFSRQRCPIFLAVLKRMGKENLGHLSFPFTGWTLALDIPTTFPGLHEILDQLDEMLVKCEGRVYLAKDSRVKPEIIEQMYSKLNEFRKIKSKYDPDSIISSDLSIRLGI